MGINLKTSYLAYKYSKTVTNGDSAKFRGKPDSILFNREEEYEVIPMLEKLLEEFGYNSSSDFEDFKEDLHKLEYMIEEDLPGKIRKRESVFDWLVENF